MEWFLLRTFVDLLRVRSLYIIIRDYYNALFLTDPQKTKT